MKELIEQIKFKADNIPSNTEMNRRVKGAYVDCLMMLKEANKTLLNPMLSLNKTKMKNPKYIKLIQFEWYLIYDKNFLPSASGYLICQYIDGQFFEQFSEEIQSEGRIVKQLFEMT